MLFLPRNYISIVSTNGLNGFSANQFDFLDKYIVRKKQTGQEFPLKDLLAKEVEFSETGILSAYSNAIISPHIIEVSPGVIKKIDLVDLKEQHSIPSYYKPFAMDLPTAIMGDMSINEHCFPNIFMFEKDFILIGANAHSNAPKDSELPLATTIYFYDEQNEAWKEVLYKSLQEFSQKNYNIALVLLFSAIDILTKNLLPGIKISRIDNRLKMLRSKITETDTSISDFKKSIKRFDKKVTTPRNSFEHEHRQVSLQVMKDAYLATFHIIWILSQMSCEEVKGNKISVLKRLLIKISSIF